MERWCVSAAGPGRSLEVPRQLSNFEQTKPNKEVRLSRRLHPFILSSLHCLHPEKGPKENED